MREQIEEWAEDAGELLMFADGFDQAIIGIGRQFNKIVVVYDEEKVINILQESHGMSEEEAVEYYEFNIVGAFVGDATPIFMSKTILPCT